MTLCGRREVLAAAVARMRAAKRQEQSPAHGVPDVPRTTQGWRGRGPAQERHGAAHAPELTRGGGCDQQQVLAIVVVAAAGN